MLKQKLMSQRGKNPLSKVFSELKEGDKVALVRDLSYSTAFPRRLQGKTGIVKEKRGNAYVIELYDGGKLKKITSQKVNLKKLHNDLK